MSIVLCPQCACGCVPVEIPCLQRYTAIHNLNVNTHARLLDLTNSFIARNLLGELCFNQLCEAIKKAVADASDDKQADKWQNYLPAIWKSIVQSQYFIRTYYLALLANYDMYGDSISQLTADGRVTHKRPIQEGGKENVYLREAQYMAARHGQELNFAIINARSYLVYPLYKQNRLPCYGACSTAAHLINCEGNNTVGGKFWHT